MLTAILIFVGILILWVVFLRRWLKTKTWAQSFFALIEPIELAIYKKSETILFARSLQALGIVGSAMAWLGGVDLTPLYAVLPEHWKWIIPLVPLIASYSCA